MSKPVQKKADIQALQLLSGTLGNVMDYQSIMVYVMKACGCTYREIGEVFNISPQLAEYQLKKFKEFIK